MHGNGRYKYAGYVAFLRDTRESEIEPRTRAVTSKSSMHKYRNKPQIRFEEKSESCSTHKTDVLRNTARLWECRV